MNRRRFLAAAGGGLGLAVLSGCTGFLETDGNETPEHPGGTLVVENTGNSSLTVSVWVVEERFSGTLDTTVEGGATVVEREFVTASAGDVVTLAARIGDEGEPTTFEFLPGGGEGDAPPEIARLSVENAVEASATWTASEGTADQ